MLEPDRDQLEIFVDALFRRAGDKGFVAVRSFYEGADKPFRLSTANLSGGLRFLIEVAEDNARRAAQNPAPVVFCPPLAVFGNKDHAREQDLLEGLAQRRQYAGKQAAPALAARPTGYRQSARRAQAGPRSRSCARRGRPLQQAGLSSDPLAGLLASESRAATVQDRAN